MGKQIEKSGKTVDEAIWNGVQEMGLSVDEVDIEIIQKGSLGLLGIGAKPAIVRLTEKEHEALDIKSMFEVEEKPSGSPIQEKNNRRKNVKRHEKTQRERKSREEKVSPVIFEDSEVAMDCMDAENKEFTENRENFTAPNNEDINEVFDRAEKNEVEPKDMMPEVIYSEEYAKANNATKFLSELLKYMNVDAKVLAAESEGNLKIKIDTEAAGVLIGHRGETLDALQYLTLLVANRDRGQNDYTRVSIDTQGYREKREEVLVRLAKSKASTVRASGKQYKFEPMSPYERRIIHATLQNNAHVTTHSEGTEPYRYVVITSTHIGRRPRRRPTAHNYDENA